MVYFLSGHPVRASIASLQFPTVIVRAGPLSLSTFGKKVAVAYHFSGKKQFPLNVKR